MDSQDPQRARVFLRNDVIPILNTNFHEPDTAARFPGPEGKSDTSAAPLSAPPGQANSASRDSPEDSSQPLSQRERLSLGCSPPAEHTNTSSSSQCRPRVLSSPHEEHSSSIKQFDGDKMPQGHSTFTDVSSASDSVAQEHSKSPKTPSKKDSTSSHESTLCIAQGPSSSDYHSRPGLPRSPLDGSRKASYSTISSFSKAIYQGSSDLEEEMSGEDTTRDGSGSISGSSASMSILYTATVCSMNCPLEVHHRRQAGQLC